MKQSENLKLNMPEGFDKYDVAHFNQNTEKIDTEISKNREDINNLLKLLTEKINEIKSLTATAQSLGLVKGGGNVDIAEDGTMSVNIKSDDIHIASESAAGLVKGGGNVDIAEDGTMSVIIDTVHKAKNGYAFLPNGLRMCWTWAGGKTSTVVTFPRAFSSVDSYSVAVLEGHLARTVTGYHGGNYSATQITINQYYSSGSGIVDSANGFWLLAIGY